MPDLLTSTVEIVVNGQKKMLPGGLTLLEALQVCAVPLDRIAVEKDRLIVPKTKWASTPVEAGAQIEIVQFVGGG